MEDNHGLGIKPSSVLQNQIIEIGAPVFSTHLLLPDQWLY